MIQIAYSITDCRTDLISLQAATFHAFMPDVSLVVVNNAVPGLWRSAIDSESRRLGLRTVDVAPDRQNRETANWIHASALTWLWSEVILHDQPSIALLLDFDMFPIAPFSLPSLLGDGVIAGVPQSRPIGPIPTAHYFWPAFLAFDLDRLPDPDTVNLNCGISSGANVDVGGMLDQYLKAHPDLPTTDIPCRGRITHASGLDLLPVESHPSYDDAFRCDLLASARVLHYTGGSGWDYPDPSLTARKTQWVRLLIEKRLSGEWEMP